MELRRFLKMTGWFSAFIKAYARKSAKLSKVLRVKKKWAWTSHMEKEYIGLK